MLPKVNIHAFRGSIYKESYYEFVKWAFTVLNPGEEFVDNWHIRYLCDLIQKRIKSCINRDDVQDDVINIPPGSMKSIMFCVCPIGWAWIHDQTFCQLGVSYSGDLAIDHCMKARKIVESPEYRAMFPHVRLAKAQNAKSKFETDKGGVRMGAGIGATVTGMHFHAVTVDDPLNPKKARSDAERDTANKEYDVTLQSRVKNPDSAWFCIVMQRLHEGDTTGHSLRKAPTRYNHICIPAENSGRVSPPELVENYQDGLFWPSRFSPAFIARQKEGLGSRGYAMQYQQDDTPEEGDYIKKYWISFYDKKKAMTGNEVINFTVDTAFGKPAAERYEKTNIQDFSAILGGFTRDGRAYITCRQKNKLNTPEWMKEAPLWLKANGYGEESRVLIEPKANGQPLIDLFYQPVMANDGNKYSINVLAFPLPGNDSKVVRLMAQAPKIEAGKLCLPLGDTPMTIPHPNGEKVTVYVEHWVPDYVDHLCGFPNMQHDEDADITEMFLRAFVQFELFESSLFG